MVRCYDDIGNDGNPADGDVSVTPPRYGVPMLETTPSITMTDAELEAWFAAAGLTVTVVPSCPDPSCRFCNPTALDRAA
jgi:hypothetical protein